MQILHGRNDILIGLRDLKVGQTALVKCDRTSDYIQEDLRNGYRFRTFMVFDDGTSQVKMRDKTDQNGMISDEHKFYESCFSNDENRLATNIDEMLSHDVKYFDYSKMVIFEFYETRLDALIIIQEGCYDEQKLEDYGCEVFSKVKSRKGLQCTG